MKKKCLSFLSVFIGLFIVLSVFPVYAADYGAVYPQYVKQSNACFIECDTVLGKGSLVFPINYQRDYIGFYGSSGTEVMNLYSSSITGQFVLENGTTYTVRAQGFSKFQYQSQEGYYNSYYDLNVSTIYNTNVQFSDSLSDRGNTVFDFSIFESALLSVLIVFFFLFFVLLLKK